MCGTTRKTATKEDVVEIVVDRDVVEIVVEIVFDREHSRDRR